jgi:transcriptional regulator with XRE-family HTH domain
MNTNLAESLKRLRKAHGLTQQKLAQEAGVSLIVVTKVEQGVTKDPAMSSLVKMADAMGLSIDDLIGRQPFRAIPKSEPRRPRRWAATWPVGAASLLGFIPPGRRAGR